jgi:hypothetical protein
MLRKKIFMDSTMPMLPEFCHQTIMVSRNNGWGNVIAYCAAAANSPSQADHARYYMWLLYKIGALVEPTAHKAAPKLQHEKLQESIPQTIGEAAALFRLLEPTAALYKDKKAQSIFYRADIYSR